MAMDTAPMNLRCSSPRTALASGFITSLSTKACKNSPSSSPLNCSTPKTPGTPLPYWGGQVFYPHGPAPFLARSLESEKLGAPSGSAGSPPSTNLSLINCTQSLNVPFLGLSPSQAFLLFSPLFFQPWRGLSLEPRKAEHSPFPCPDSRQKMTRKWRATDA